MTDDERQRTVLVLSILADGCSVFTVYHFMYNLNLQISWRIWQWSKIETRSTFV